MGKKKDKNITIRDIDFHYPDKDLRKTLDYFNVKGAGGGGRPGNMGTGSDNRRTADDVKADLKEAKASHYAFNHGLMSAAMSGDKKSKNLMESGMGNVGGIMRGVNHLSKLKKDNFGGGGMNGGENQTVLAYDLANLDREKQTAGYDEKYATKDDLSALSQQQSVESKETYEPSPELAEAKERVAAWESGTYDKGIYGNDESSANPYGVDDQQDDASISPTDTSGNKAQSMLDSFKEDLKERKKLTRVF